VSSARDDVWQALLAHQQRAFRVARARSGRADDAQDLVQEAMARVAAMPAVDVDRVGPLLATVVAHLAVDEHRRRARACAAAARAGTRRDADLPYEDAVCDAHEARWLWSLRGQLVRQDRRVLELRAQGRTLAEAAAELGITYKAAENALARARARLRAAWSATAAVIGVLLARAPVRQRHTVLAVAPAVLAAVAITTLVVPAVTPSVPPAVPEERPLAVPSVAPALPSRGVYGGSASAHRPSPSLAGAVAQSAAVPAAPALRPPVRVATDTFVTPVATVQPLGVEQHRPDETLLDTAQRCLREGPSVTLPTLGCPP
jgi:RNA polymerase sigma factor (sigma-70 family)